MRIDKLVMHADDVKPGDGSEFYGSPIYQACILDSDVREELDLQSRVRLGLGAESAPIELLPGEIVKDNIIRRETTAEVVGEQFYAEKSEEGISGLKETEYWDNYYNGGCQ